MRQSNQIDLKTEGGSKSVTVVPGGSVTLNINAQQSRIGAAGGGRGLYNTIRGVWVRGSMIVVRSSGGSTVVYADQFPRAVKSINWQNPLLGTLVDPTVMNGMVAKHIGEFFGMGYHFAGVNRQPIPGSDATYTRTFEIYIPLADDLNEFPDHFNHWLGWHDEAFLELFVEDAAQPFGLSGVTITSVTFSAELDMVPMGELIIPPVAVVRKYEQTAASGSNGPQLIGVGNNGALQGFDDASRLMAMLFAHQTGGFVGSGTADQISSLTLPWRDQAQTTLPEFLFARFLRGTGKPNRMGAATGQDLFDNTPPYSMWANPGTGPLNDASARYTPFVWPEKGNLISQFQKVKGNYPIDMVFSANQSGTFRVYTKELKQISQQKASELCAAAGIDPSKVDLVPKLGRKNKGAIDADKGFCLPRGVVKKKAA
jgi:hypothetical protein